MSPPGQSVPSPMAKPTLEDDSLIEGPLVAEIVFEGLRGVSEEEARQTIALEIGRKFTPARGDADLRRLLALGAFRTRAEESYVHTEPVGDQVRVIFHLTENPAVRGIVFEGNTVLSAEALTAAVQGVVRPGDVYRTDIGGKVAEQASGAYLDAGYAALVLHPTLDDAGVLHVPLIEQYIEDVEIEGLRKTKRKLVMSEIRTRPGQLYNLGLIRRDLDRLIDLGLFDSVAVADPRPGTQTGAVILVYQLDERKTGTFDAGLGYGPKDGLIGYVAVSENNLGGHGRKLGVRAEFGGTYAFDLHFSDPFLDSHHTSIELDVYSRRTRTDLVGFAGLSSPNQVFGSETHTGGVVSLSRPLDRDRKRLVNVSYMNEYVNNQDARLINILDPSALRGRVGKLSAGFINDSRDMPSNPARGGREAIQIEQAAGVLGSSFTFTKFGVDLRRYFEIGDRSVIALRGMYGLVRGQNTPIFEAFRAGGMDTIRGYREDRFVGSNVVLLNAEYRYRLFGDDPRKSLQALAFVDYGDAYGGTWPGLGNAVFYSEHQQFTGNLGVGVGLRWNTRLGPIGVDYGVGREGGRGYLTFRQTF